MGRMQRTLTSAIYISSLLAAAVLWPTPLLATTYTVMSGGGGNFTTIQACANAMAPGDTCTVFAGKYNENVTVPAGTAGNYKTITANGSDIVTVLSFTLNSHTKLIGNCPSAPSTFGTCGFSIQPSSTSTACISIGSSTDVFVRNNTGYECGTLSMSSSASYIYIQGNTLSQMCRKPGTGGTCAGGGTTAEGIACDGIAQHGSHVLVEGNDISHYRLGINYQGDHCLFRNNNLHDQIESESGQHTDAFFSEPAAEPSQYHVIEGNTQNNACGPNAKGNLSQGDACSGNCFNLIVRFNTSSNIDSGGFITDDNAGSSQNPGFYNVKTYNNTLVNYLRGGSLPGIVDYYNSHSNNPTDVNNLFYWPGTIAGAGGSPVYVSGVTTPTWGYNLSFCASSSSSNCNLLGHTETGSFNGDATGNIYGCTGCNPSNDPLFVNPSGGNYALQAGSSAIAKGTYLTTVASGDSGSGTSLIVNDAAPFQDGMGLQNPYSTVQGDCISVTTVGNHVCITSINYSTNTLTLASGITRSSGDKVWLHSKSDGVQVLTGSAPDMGAYPYGVGGSNPPLPPTNLSAVVQ
jgi:hypothetical protein